MNCIVKEIIKTNPQVVETSNYYIPKIFVSKKNNKINKINEIKKRKYILDKKSQKIVMTDLK